MDGWIYLVPVTCDRVGNQISSRWHFGSRLEGPSFPTLPHQSLLFPKSRSRASRLSPCTCLRAQASGLPDCPSGVLALSGHRLTVLHSVPVACDRVRSAYDLCLRMVHASGGAVPRSRTPHCVWNKTIQTFLSWSVSQFPPQSL